MSKVIRNKTKSKNKRKMSTDDRVLFDPLKEKFPNISPKVLDMLFHSHREYLFLCTHGLDDTKKCFDGFLIWSCSMLKEIGMNRIIRICQKPQPPSLFELIQNYSRQKEIHRKTIKKA